MNWIILALSSAIFAALRDATMKFKAKGIDAYLLSWGQSLFSFPILLICLLVSNRVEITYSFLFFSILSGCLLALAWALYIKAISLSELSLVIPIITITPLIISILNIILFSEWPNIKGLTGMTLIVIGGYTLGIDRKKYKAYDPIIKLFQDPGSRVMLVAVTIMSVLAMLEKEGVRHSTPMMQITMQVFIASLIFYPYAIKKIKNPLSQIKKNYSTFIFIGILVAGMFIFQMNAYVTGPTAYIVALKRLSVVFGILFGCLFFKEKNLGQKILASTIMLLGAFLISSS